MSFFFVHTHVSSHVLIACLEFLFPTLGTTLVLGLKALNTSGAAYALQLEMRREEHVILVALHHISIIHVYSSKSRTSEIMGLFNVYCPQVGPRPPPSCEELVALAGHAL